MINPIALKIVNKDNPLNTDTMAINGLSLNEKRPYPTLNTKNRKAKVLDRNFKAENMSIFISQKVNC